MNVEPKVQRWAERELDRYLNRIIVPGNGRDVIAFGKFVLRPFKHGCRVLELSNIRGNFSDRRVALSWCVATNLKRYDLANTIAMLDQQLSIVEQDCEARKKIAMRSSQPQFQSRVLTKLQAKNSYRKRVSDQLEKCISLTKYLQLRGFRNETARTRCV